LNGIDFCLFHRLPVRLTSPWSWSADSREGRAAYGFWHSKLAKGIDITEETTINSPAQALGRGVDDIKED